MVSLLTGLHSPLANFQHANIALLSLGTANVDQPRRRDLRDDGKPPLNSGRDQSEDESSLTREKERSRELKNYVVKDGDFASFPEICQTSVTNMTARGYKSLFPIQQHSFYPIYNKEDIIARDLTGSGKTLAFCLPLTEDLRRQRKLGQRKIRAIMMCPTRELAI